MAQFNVDSEVIAAKSAQARSYVASITADVNGMTAVSYTHLDVYKRQGAGGREGTQRCTADSHAHCQRSADSPEGTPREDSPAPASRLGSGILSLIHI